MHLNAAQQLFHAVRPAMGPYVAEQFVRNIVHEASRFRFRLDVLNGPHGEVIENISGLSAAVDESLLAVLATVNETGLHEALGGAFTWAYTDQGRDFWHNVLMGLPLGTPRTGFIPVPRPR